MTDQVRLSFAVANICGNPAMPQDDVVADVAQVAGLRADVTSFAEISRRRYKRAVRRAFGKVYNLRTEIPTATDLPVRRSWVRKLYDGVARVTPGRFNAGVRLDTQIPVLVIAKHPVSGSYRKGAAARRTFGLGIRKRLFARDVRRTAAKVRRANAKGVVVVPMGDLNAVRPPAYSDDQVVALRLGLMWVIVCPPPGVTVHVGADQVIHTHEHGGPLHTDHSAGRVNVTLTRDAS